MERDELASSKDRNAHMSPTGSGDGTAAAGPAREKGSFALLGAIVGGHAMKHVFNAGFFVILPEMKSALGLSNANIGTFSTVRAVVGGVANAPAGFAADRYGTRIAPMLAGTLIAIGVFQFALGRSVAFWDALLYATLVNLFITAWHPPAIGALSKIFADRRGLAISLHGTGASLGEVVGPLMTGALLLSLNWRVLLQLSLAPALVAALAVWLLARSYPFTTVQVSVREYFRAFGELVHNGKVLIVLLIVGGFAASQAAMFTFLPIYVREDLGGSTLTVGLYVSLAQAAGIGSQPIMGHLLDRAGRRVVIIPSLFAMGASLMVLYLVGSGPLFLLALAVAGAFLFSVTAMLVTAALDVAGDLVQGTAVSLIYSVIALFSGIGPLIAGFVADGFGVRTVFLLAALAALASSAVALATRWERT